MIQLGEIFHECGTSIARLMFPPACAFCHRDVEDEYLRRKLCERCAVMLAPLGIEHCPRCGLRYPPGVLRGADCEQCRTRRPAYEAVWTLGAYDDLLRRAVLRGKRPEGQILMAALASLLYERHADSLHAWSADLLAPTPLFWLRRAWRGANSPETIAETLGKELLVPAPSFAVRRRRWTRPQAGLPQRERGPNVRGAFRAGKPKHCDFRGARVLLVDDILTSGATLTEMARVVRDAGASAVAAVVIARAEAPL
jgi:predicted amidophosphoribosyltransferase